MNEQYNDDDDNNNDDELKWVWVKLHECNWIAEHDQHITQMIKYDNKTIVALFQYKCNLSTIQSY